jgi:hypothetical protein
VKGGTEEAKALALREGPESSSRPATPGETEKAGTNADAEESVDPNTLSMPEARILNKLFAWLVMNQGQPDLEKVIDRGVKAMYVSYNTTNARF